MKKLFLIRFSVAAFFCLLCVLPALAVNIKIKGAVKDKLSKEPLIGATIRFTASAPVVSLASHFDGGCPCESGMPIQLSAGGTCNAELAATFAPRPQLIVSDGGDWTASVPTLEFPYLQRIYGFYQAKDKVTNVHLPKEKHDFGPNKRNAVYDFFAEVFKLDKKMLDESKVTIEPESAMYSFGEKGALLPEGAIRSFDKV